MLVLSGIYILSTLILGIICKSLALAEAQHPNGVDMYREGYFSVVSGLLSAIYSVLKCDE